MSTNGLLLIIFTIMVVLIYKDNEERTDTLEHIEIPDHLKKNDVGNSKTWVIEIHVEDEHVYFQYAWSDTDQKVISYMISETSDDTVGLYEVLHMLNNFHPYGYNLGYR